MPLHADILARAPLAPVLAFQALGVRRNAQLLPEPPGPRAGKIGDGPPLRLLILGDSSAAGVGASTQAKGLSGQLSAELGRFHHVHWRLRAQTGATTRDALDWLADEPSEMFDVVVCALGVNDVTRARSVSRWRQEQTRLAEMLRDRHDPRLIIASGLPPMGHYPMLPNPLRWILGSHAARLDRQLADLATRREGLVHLPLDLPFQPRYMARDGYHPSEEAYTLWAGLLARCIRENLV